MSLSQDKTKIGNMALNHIGKLPIQNIDDKNNPAAVRISLVWDPALEATLRAKDWSFARVRKALSQVSNVAIDGWENIYVYPPTCFNIWKVYVGTDDSENKGVSFEQGFDPLTNQRLILTNTEAAFARYTHLVTDPTVFDPTFNEALSLKIASLIAKPLTGDSGLSDKFLQGFISFVSEAKRLDSDEKNDKSEVESSIVASRG
jgi:hypothetical protein